MNSLLNINVIVSNVQQTFWQKSTFKVSKMYHQRPPSNRQQNLPIRFRSDVKENRTSYLKSKPPKVVQKVHKKSTNFSRLKSIVCTNETKSPKFEKAIGESPVIAKNEAIPQVHDMKWYEW